MRDVWSILAYVALIVGGTATLLMAIPGSWDTVLKVGGATALIVIVCSLMVWRHDVEAREADRHQEMMRALLAIYRSVKHDD